jgi:histidinol-phosphate aminotransferase
MALNRYPDGRVNDLRHALAAYAHMPEGCDIMLGNGSDELISLLAMACDVAKDPGDRSKSRSSWRLCPAL